MPVRAPATAPESVRLARMVGWMSVAFGLFDGALAGRLARGVGMESAAPFRLAAAREIATGAAALIRPDNPAPIVARIAGDIADLVTLGTVAARPGNDRRGMALLGVGIVVGVLLVDAVAVRRLTQAATPLADPRPSA